MLGAPSRMEWWPALRFTQPLWSMLGVDEMRWGTKRCDCAFPLPSVAPAMSVGLSSIYARSDEVID